MAEQTYQYLIVGASLTGASAADGIREIDRQGSILLIGSEPHLPYERPPLSKKLWFGKTTVDKIFVHDEAYYHEQHVELLRETTVVSLDAERRMVTDNQGRQYGYEKLLLATGGVPRTLDIPGGDLAGVCYYRYLDDYLRTRATAGEGKSAVVIGGGFIGSELAAALALNGVEVTMIYPDDYLVNRVFAEGLGRALTEKFRARGIRMLTHDLPASFSRADTRFLTTTQNGVQVASDIIIVGIGISPSMTLAAQAGVEVGNGIIVNATLQTSRPEIYAAGDNAFFPYAVLGKSTRVEHWDNALNQGKYAGRNMAGANEAYTYMPYFFSDLFEFGYEAVGEVDGRLDTFADWQKEYDTGVIYYLRDNRVRGVMLCNVWGKLDAARELIRRGEQVSPEELRGAIRE